MINTVVKWEFNLGEKKAVLYLDHDTSIHLTKEIGYEILKQCVLIEENEKKKQLENQNEVVECPIQAE